MWGNWKVVWRAAWHTRPDIDTFMVPPPVLDVVPAAVGNYILYSFHLCRSVMGAHKPHLNEWVLCSVAPTVGNISPGK